MIGPLVGASFSEVTRLIDVLAWPAVVVFAVAVAASDRGRRLLRPVLRRIRKVAGPGGFALELSEEAAAATKADVEGAIRDFSGALQDEFDRLAYAEDVRNRLSAAVRDLLDGHDLPDGHDYRATVHIRDALYADALYQLVDYWPRGRGAGRRFPERSGMLGKAWRLERSIYAPNVPTEREKLIAEWGMTSDEADEAARGRQSFACAVLRHGGSLVGVLYMDAKCKNAFPSDIDKQMDASQLVAAVAAAVGRVREAIAARGPGLSLLQK